MAIKAMKKRAKRVTVKAKSVAAKAPKAAKKSQAPRIKLTKGHIRKRNALRKSLGKKIADQAFSKWLKAQKSAIKKAPKRDAAAEKIATALKPLSSKKINFGTYGYTIRRAKGKGAKGLVVIRNTKLAKAS